MNQKISTISEIEKNEVITNFFKGGKRLQQIPSKEKRKLILLEHIVATSFKKNHLYSEEEVKDILKEIHEDHASLRRYLIVYGFMNRSKDCSQYWVN
ncbi:DUF2087 domain-containing protein [Fredinandcohnia quinoae]|uniref:DUF2087 domain-containing protein n=1 Tax=Fredinandcohnia quinoae TaxID=2918902 RepID=A0AAW5E1E6_9BACI|nr:DUF2087 domain-containing protein [Fredinandcohnia sp. SECRCQ15]MCH1625394.1 DUF2087 domain-containing protein [Fredinandcohnia sp. SECRCQ15]